MGKRTHSGRAVLSQMRVIIKENINKFPHGHGPQTTMDKRDRTGPTGPVWTLEDRDRMDPYNQLWPHK